MSALNFFTSLNGSVSVGATSQALGDTEAGRVLAERLTDAAMTFEVVNGRAIQVETLKGSRFPSPELP